MWLRDDSAIDRPWNSYTKWIFNSCMKLHQNITRYRNWKDGYIRTMSTFKPTILARNRNLRLLYSITIFSFCFHSSSFCTVYGNGMMILSRTIKQTSHILSTWSRMQTANASMSGQCIPQDVNRIFWRPAERPCTLIAPTTSWLSRLTIKQVTLGRTSVSTGNLLEHKTLPN